eukprot:TRINITY_DN54834_c0_g1_i2.p1 TRINITY_DN54834_c0_g1~~TRINITY_DN54834_c0_g1_i2.p1  ORF type:complete len:606 (+),score=54.90 TRINITY_DN54834_c0_g1_i2:74-1819(+)
MSESMRVPFSDWSMWWHENPHAVSLAAGAFAGLTTELTLFPLDCLKTRVQSQQGFLKSGSCTGLYRGVGTACMGSIPASAVFFTTFEFSKQVLGGDRNASPGQVSVTNICLASMMAELTAASIRVPVDIVKQRLQANPGTNFVDVVRSVSMTRGSVVLASFQTFAARDLMHSGIQFPLYEYLKVLCARRTRCKVDTLPTWQSAVCGSIAGSVSALLTTPLDVVKTRVNLRKPDHAAGDSVRRNTILREEITELYAARGLLGFYTGASLRALWMGLGGFFFLGSFELAKKSLSPPKQAAQPQEEVPLFRQVQPEKMRSLSSTSTGSVAVDDEWQLGQEPPAWVFCVSGLIAGLAVDIPLHPVDTVKTRMQAPGGFQANGGWRGLWNGVSAVLLVSMPISAIFFFTYEHIRYVVDRTLPQTSSWESYRIARDGAAASIADICACLVRVPCEVLKQRMQAPGSSGGVASSSKPLSFAQTVRSVRAEGLLGFYVGFLATISREVPFAFIQMPLFEDMKHRHPWAAGARETGDTWTMSLIGLQSGGLAGAVAGVITTPLDAAKTQIMLSRRPPSAEQRTISWRAIF